MAIQQDQGLMKLATSALSYTQADLPCSQLIPEQLGI